MKMALRLAVGLLALAAVFALPVVLEARGYFDPPQDRASFETRLAVAQGYLAPARERFFTSNPKIRRTMAESIATLEKDFPEVLGAHRDEIEAIYDGWLEAIADFSAAAHAHWFAVHFTADDIRAYFERNQMWGPATLRRSVVFLVHRGELEAIKKRTETVMICRLAQDVLPALADLGAGPASPWDDLRSTCRETAEQGELDPASLLH